MEMEPENQDQHKKPASNQQEENNNEELAKEIPTVTPDTENIEPVPDVDDNK